MTTPAELLPFLRGAVWPAVPGASYPRADPADARRLPADTWAEAQIPIGVRLEMTAEGRGIEVGYSTVTDDFGYRGPGAGSTFSAWRGGTQVDEDAAVVGSATARLSIGDGSGRVVVYLPEGMRPTITSLKAVDGRIEPAPRQPPWLAYGDSITAGWVASSPARGWVATAGREHHLDAVNLGYAGSGRGEIASAEQMATITADVISLSHGTNCWNLAPHSEAMMRANTVAFLRVLRSQHATVPIIVVSPLLRPDAESRANRLGATLGDLRRAMEEAVTELKDPLVTLVHGRDLVPADMLEDGVHPNDRGHRALADILGPVVRAAIRQVPGRAPNLHDLN